MRLRGIIMGGVWNISDCDTNEAFSAERTPERTFPTTFIKIAVKGAPLLLNVAWHVCMEA